MLTFEPLQMNLEPGFMGRAAIVGGWLVIFEQTADDGQPRPSLTFVPDPQHQWDGNSADLTPKPYATPRAVRTGSR